jgi:SulP family sulfate permease
MLKKIGIEDKVGSENIYRPESEYFAATNKALEMTCDENIDADNNIIENNENEKE